MAATINPCGFALLPAYLSAFVGMNDDDRRGNAVLRALSVTAVLTAGFVTVFGLFGAVLSQVFEGIEQHLPWATIVIGFALIGLGIYLLTGRQLVLNIPKLNRGGSDGTLLSMYLFGVSYAIASLSCTIGVFLAVTSSTFNNGGYLSGVMVFVVYGLGMGVIVGVLTLAVALAKDGVVRRFRSLLPKMNMFAGVLLLLSGAYVAYYGWYEVRLFNGEVTDDPVVDTASDVQQWLLQYLPSQDSAPWYGLVAVLMFAAAGFWAYRRRARSGPVDPPAEPSQDGAATEVAAET